MRRSHVITVILLLIALALVGCGGKDETPPPSATPLPSAVPTAQPTATPTPLPAPVTNSDPLTQAQLRVVQASPDLPPVNIYLDGANIGRGFNPGDYHATPLSYQAADYLLRVVPAGENPDTGPRLLEQHITLVAGHSIVAVIAGPASDLRLILAEESLDPLPNATARLVVIDALPDSSAIDVQENARTLLTALSYTASGGPVELPEGDHRFTLSGTALAAPFDLALSAHYTYTVVFFAAADGALDVINFRSRANDETQVRLIQASPDLPAVDVYLDDVPLGTNLPFRGSTDWQGIRSLRYTLRVLPAGQPDADPLLQKQVTLTPSAALDLVLLDTRDQLRVTTVEEDLDPTSEGYARLVFVQAAPDVVQTSIQAVGQSDLGLRPIAFGTASRPIEYAAGTETFSFSTTVGSVSQEIDRLPDAVWQAGYSYTVVITGEPDHAPIVLRTSVGTAVPTGPTGTTASTADNALAVRVIDALPDVPALDFNADGSLIFEGIRPGTTTDYHTFAVPPTHLTLRATSDGTLLFDEDVVMPRLAAPARLVLIVARDQGDITTLAAADIPYTIPDGEALVRVFNLTTAAATLRVDYLSTLAARATPTPTPSEDASIVPLTEAEALALRLVTEPLVPQAPYRLAGDPAAVPAGLGALSFTDADTGSVVATWEFTFASGVYYDLVLLPDSSGLGVDPLPVPQPTD